MNLKYLNKVSFSMKSLLRYDVLKPEGISIKLPVIFLHGFFGCKSNLRHIANSPLIHSNRTCYLLDLRNHGDSFHAQSMHYNAITSDIITFMNYVGINRAIWIGHSYGAKIAYYAALQYSSYVSSLIALDIGIYLFLFYLNIICMLYIFDIYIHSTS